MNMKPVTTAVTPVVTTVVATVVATVFTTCVTSITTRMFDNSNYGQGHINKDCKDEFNANDKNIRLSVYFVKYIIVEVKNYDNFKHFLKGSQGYDCNFEQGICSPYWNQATNDNMDFTRRRGSTPSVATGPSVDHTLGNGILHHFD